MSFLISKLKLYFKQTGKEIVHRKAAEAAKFQRVIDSSLIIYSFKIGTLK